MGLQNKIYFFLTIFFPIDNLFFLLQLLQLQI